MPNTRPLNERQREFARQYAVTGNASESARRAGYSEKSAARIGSDLLKDPRISGAVAQARTVILADAEQRTGVESGDVLRGLYNEATREGKGSTHAARVSAWRAIGDALGMFRSTDAPAGVAAVSAVRVEIVLPEHADAVAHVLPPVE